LQSVVLSNLRSIAKSLIMLESTYAGVSINPVDSAIIKTLAYFDVFHHPLTMSEIARYCRDENADYPSIRQAVNQLVSDGIIFRLHHFYSLQNDLVLAEKRKEENKRAKKYLRIAKLLSKLIAAFPFVRGVYLSGSLSKGCATKDADIDYFVITKPNRLWLCRTLLMLFKKIFLLNSRKYFCINYFVDTDHLEIPDRNIFTATEIATIIPTYNPSLYSKFMNANQWIHSYFPNFQQKQFAEQEEVESSWVKRMSENLFGGTLGNQLEKFCFRITTSKWREKFRSMNEHEFENNLRSKSYVSKHHPKGMQFHVLHQFEQKLRNFEHRFQLKLF
jgi:Nucleotidyltransferase domain